MWIELNGSYYNVDTAIQIRPALTPGEFIIVFPSTQVQIGGHQLDKILKALKVAPIFLS